MRPSRDTRPKSPISMSTKTLLELESNSGQSTKLRLENLARVSEMTVGKLRALIREELKRAIKECK